MNCVPATCGEWLLSDLLSPYVIPCIDSCLGIEEDILDDRCIWKFWSKRSWLIISRGSLADWLGYANLCWFIDGGYVSLWYCPGPGGRNSWFNIDDEYGLWPASKLCWLIRWFSLRHWTGFTYPSLSSASSCFMNFPIFWQFFKLWFLITNSRSFMHTHTVQTFSIFVPCLCLGTLFPLPSLSERLENRTILFTAHCFRIDSNLGHCSASCFILQI